MGLGPGYTELRWRMEASLPHHPTKKQKQEKNRNLLCVAFSLIPSIIGLPNILNSHFFFFCNLDDRPTNLRSCCRRSHSLLLRYLLLRLKEPHLLRETNRSLPKEAHLEDEGRFPGAASDGEGREGELDHARTTSTRAGSFSSEQISVACFFFRLT